MRLQFDRAATVRRHTLRPYGAIEIETCLLLLLLLLNSHVHFSSSHGRIVVNSGSTIYLFIIKSYTEYNKHIKNEHRKHTEKKLKNKNTRIVTEHTIKH